MNMRTIHTNLCRAQSLILALSVGALASAHGCKSAPKTDLQASQTASIPEVGSRVSATNVGASEPEEHWMPPRQFLQTVARNDMLQMAVGELAKSESNAPAVKDLGRRLVANHTAIQVIIANVAKSEGAVLPDTLPTDDQLLIAQMSSMQGQQFAKAYASLMAKHNAQMLVIFKWQSEHCTQPAIKTFASQTLPIVGTHARLSDALNQEFNKEELRLAAEQKAAEQRAAEVKKAQEAAAAEARAARRAPRRK
jgi:putative membrane protein